MRSVGWKKSFNIPQFEVVPPCIIDIFLAVVLFQSVLNEGMLLDSRFMGFRQHVKRP